MFRAVGFCEKNTGIVVDVALIQQLVIRETQDGASIPELPGIQVCGGPIQRTG